MSVTVLPDGRVVLPSSDPAVQRVTGWERFYVGLDLGRSDPTSIVIVKDSCHPRYATGFRQELGERSRVVVYSDRVRDTSYMDIANHLTALLPRLPSWVLTIDASGLGVPFSDYLIQAGVEHFALTMTGGTQLNRTGYRVNCSKNLLLETMASGFETGQLTIADDLPLRKDLIQEISSFELATTAAGNLVLEGGGKGHHADAAVALALAYLTSERLAATSLGTVKLTNYW